MAKARIYGSFKPYTPNNKEVRRAKPFGKKKGKKK